LLNRGTPGYWIADRKLELVLLRSFANYTGYQKSGLRKKVPGYEKSTQTELAREHGTHEFEYALLPHSGTWRAGRLPQSGRSYNTPLLGMPGLGPAVRRQTGRSFLACSPGFVLTALKRAESAEGLILRGYETTGEAHQVSLRLPRTVKRIHRASLIEEPADKLPISRGQVEFSCRPHEIVTFWLPG
jgi:alpha-mannosidase